MFLIGFLLAGETVLGLLRIPPPNMFKSFWDSKYIYSFMVFFFGSQFAAQYLMTGAFEVYINGELAFSKLATGRMPDAAALNEAFMSHGIQFR
mmetsp:Transcript_65642/g.90798  ORF Transcript_65642/g.90798 Transcript_65642/m.90798 type:complete len:93 (+) Transcript_65642:581-859(+)